MWHLDQRLEELQTMKKVDLKDRWARLSGRPVPKVQAKLEDNRQGTQRAATVWSSSVLAGLVCDEAGQPLVSSHACKGKVRYRYYVSKALQHDPGD